MCSLTIEIDGNDEMEQPWLMKFTPPRDVPSDAKETVDESDTAMEPSGNTIGQLESSTVKFARKLTARR